MYAPVSTSDKKLLKSNLICCSPDVLDPIYHYFQIPVAQSKISTSAGGDPTLLSYKPVESGKDSPND